MIHSVTVTNHLNEEIEIVLGNLDTSGFLITGIEGLGPCKATINSTDMATGDGTVFNSSRLEPRNIVISIVFDYNSDRSIEEIRHELYRYFPIKKQITLRFKTDSRTLETSGIVETDNPLIFSPRCGSQISILCPDPYFYSYGDDGVTVTPFGSITSGFEFVYDESLGYGVICNDARSIELVGTPELEFGGIVDNDINNLYYNGDADIGIEIEIRALNSVGDIIIAGGRDNGKMVLRSERIKKLTGQSLIADDIITISTIRNKKYVKLLRSGKYYNILNCLDKGAYWFVLARGDNTFTYKTTFGRIQMSITNRTIFEGA